MHSLHLIGTCFLFVFCDKKGSVWKQINSNLRSNSVERRHLIATWCMHKKNKNKKTDLTLCLESMPHWHGKSYTHGGLKETLAHSLFFCPRAKQLKPYLHFYSLLSHCHYLLARDSESFNHSCPSTLCCLLTLQVTEGVAEASFSIQPLYRHTHTDTHCLSSTSLAASWPSNTADCWSGWIPRRRLRAA